MTNFTRIALAVAVTLASASSSFALAKPETAHRTALSARNQAAPMVRSATRMAVQPFTAAERNWFRQAEGPEWN
jgi:hypothetical protein